jgi:hypothetical protein
MAPSMMKLTSVLFEDDATSVIIGASYGCAVNNGGCDFLCVPNGESTKARSGPYLHSIKKKSKGMLNSRMYSERSSVLP